MMRTESARLLRDPVAVFIFQHLAPGVALVRRAIDKTRQRVPAKLPLGPTNENVSRIFRIHVDLVPWVPSLGDGRP